MIPRFPEEIGYQESECRRSRPTTADLVLGLGGVWSQGPRYGDRGAATAEAAPAVSHSLFWASTLENTPE
jgi:hypothetical protein